MEKENRNRVVRQPEERKKASLKRTTEEEERRIRTKMNLIFYGTKQTSLVLQNTQERRYFNDCFKDLSCDAKILYGLMLDECLYHRIEF